MIDPLYDRVVRATLEGKLQWEETERGKFSSSIQLAEEAPIEWTLVLGDFNYSLHLMQADAGFLVKELSFRSTPEDRAFIERVYDSAAETSRQKKKRALHRHHRLVEKVINTLDQILETPCE